MSCKTVIVWKPSGLWRNRTHAQVQRQSFSILELLGPRQQVFMKRSQRSHASRFWSSLLVLAVLMIFATATAAQTEESPVVLPTAISDSVTNFDTNALVSTDATPATVVPAREHDATSLSANALMPALATVTEFPATGSPSTTPSVATIPGVATIEAPPAATAVASAVTGSTAGAEAPTAEVPTPAPGATEVLTPPLVPNDTQTAAPPVATPAIITLQNATEIPAAPPNATEIPIAPPNATEISIAPPEATEAPTAASVATNASTTTPASTPLPPAVPMPDPVATTQSPPTASNSTVAPPMPAPAATAPKPPTSTTPVTASPTSTSTEDTTAFKPPMPPSDASKLKTAGSSGTDPTSKSSSSTSKNAADATKEPADDSVADTPTGDTEGSSGLLKLAPILPDDTDADTDTDTDTKTDTVDAPTNDYDSDSAPSNASTSSPHSQSLNDWELVLVIIGAVCAVVASIFFMHMRHRRTAAANRRLRDTVSQRALDSFFWRNRVTVVRETTLSSNAEPLTPRDDIPITTSFGERSRVKTSMPIAESEAKDLDRNTQLNSTTRIVASPDDYDGDKHDSFTGPKSSSVSFSIPATTHYAYLDTSFVSIGSNTPIISSSQSSSPGNTNRTDRSSNGFSVSNMSSDGGTCRLTSQLLNKVAVPLSMSKSAPTSDTRDSSRISDDCSVDESYTESFTTQLSSTSDSFISIGENSTSQSTQDIDDNSSTTSDLSEKSARNEGEI
ncbi:unnamed protein product [Peronospora destructor]|uniref:Uncharacterized protein n=1 Tax=Peronospora destructor TaxID=86335 RepID=A0AAV0U9X1_9STRA|nr:unnamed protein product [Peronospora destructor]